MIQRKQRSATLLAVFITGLILLLFLSSFISVPFQVKTYSEVFPKQKWLLSRGRGGEIISNVIDYTQGHTTQYNISNFERGEVVTADFHNYLNGKKEFRKGDTVVFIKSTNVLNQIADLEGELNVALANLKAQNSPEKAPLIQEAREKLSLADQKIKDQEIILNRLDQLYKKGLASQQEYEISLNIYNLLKIEKNIYAAQVTNLSTGVKNEDLELLRTQIKAAESKLTSLKQQHDKLIITSPIEGRIAASYSPDTLLYVHNLNEVVLHVPVKINDINEFYPGQKITVQTNLFEEKIAGEIISIDREVQILSSQQVIHITVLVNNKNGRLLPGMLLESSLYMKESSLLNHLIRLVTQ